MPEGSILIVITECESMTAYGKHMDAWRDSEEGRNPIPRIQGEDAPLSVLTSVVWEELV